MGICWVINQSIESNFRVSFEVIDIEEGLRELHHHGEGDEAVPGDTHEAGSCSDYLISQYTHQPLHFCASTPCIFEYTFLARNVELSPN